MKNTDNKTTAAAERGANVITHKDIDDLIFLMICALNGDTPDADRVAAMNLSNIHSAAVFHSVSALAAFALERTIDLPAAFEQSRAVSMHRLALLDIERGQIFSRMSDEGIWHMPLKGVILKELYPKYGMREMSDNDILCDPERMEDIGRIMAEMGYTLDGSTNETHDVYTRYPTIFEFHRALFSQKKQEKFYNYFKDIGDRLIKCENDEYEYRFSPEDCYLYLLAHENKHYYNSGTGLRSLIDIYMYLRRYESEMDWEYIGIECEKLGLTDFEAMNRGVSQKLFSGDELSVGEKAQAYRFLTAGTFGTRERYDENRLMKKLSSVDSRESKRGYIMSRLFLSGDELKEKYPFFFRHKILLPILFVYRVFRALFKNSKALTAEVKALREK